MSELNELIPGDKVVLSGMAAVFIGLGHSAAYPGLATVVWRLDDGTISIDSLRFNQDVGQVVFTESPARRQRLLDALNGSWDGT